MATLSLGICLRNMGIETVPEILQWPFRRSEVKTAWVLVIPAPLHYIE